MDDTRTEFGKSILHLVGMGGATFTVGGRKTEATAPAAAPAAAPPAPAPALPAAKQKDPAAKVRKELDAFVAGHSAGRAGL